MDNKVSKIALFLMTYKGYKTLEYIITRGYSKSVECVIIGFDKNVKNDYSKDISDLCIEEGIKWYYKNEKFELSSKFILTVSWRWLIKNTDSRIIVFHESLLPKYRGFAPLVNQLINGENNIGMSAIFGEEDYDTGDIICQFQSKIKYPIKIQKAIEIVFELYKKAIDNIFVKLEKSGKILPKYSQNPDLATYSIWRDDSDYFIDWNKSSDYIKRFIDSVSYPYLGATSMIKNRLIRIHDVEIFPDLKLEIRDTGKVILNKDGKPVIICGEGLVKIIDAVYDDTGESIFPLKKFRIRFNSE